MRQTPADKSYIIQAVDAALCVLMEVAKSPGQGLSELARSVEETKTRTFRLLRTLERHELISSDDRGGYRLGHAILILGTAASSQIDLVKLASPVLEDLGLKVNETVQLRVRDNESALCITKFEPSRDLRVHAVVGRRRPLYAGSSKTMLAFLSDDDRERSLPDDLVALTDKTIIKRTRLMDELKKIREQGYCISRGEVSEQLISVSAPVFTAGGAIAACVNTVAPAFRTQDPDIYRFVTLVTSAATTISAGLGWQAAANS